MKNRCLLATGAMFLLAFPAIGPPADSSPPDDLIVSLTTESDDSGRTFSFKRDHEVPILTLERWPGELRSEVPAETIELFGNGLLRVTYPPYRIYEGTYELQLSQEDTDGLLGELVNSGVPLTDGRSWKREAEERRLQAEAEARSRGVTEIVGHRTSETLTVIHTQFVVENEEPATREEPQQDAVAARTFRYYGLATDAGRVREMDHLTAAASVEKRLLDLADQARTRSAEDK